jgi:hypothetical protein
VRVSLNRDIGLAQISMLLRYTMSMRCCGGGPALNPSDGCCLVSWRDKPKGEETRGRPLT